MGSKKVKGEDEANPEQEIQEEIDTGPFVNLPEEIVEMILGNLNDPKDLMAASCASPQFNRILKPSQSAWSFSEVFPQIFSQLDKNDILNCRLVCKKWKQYVDNFIQNHARKRYLAPYQYHPTRMNLNGGRDEIYNRNHPDHAPQYQPSLVSKEFYGVNLRSVNQITRYMEKMKNHSGNPFVLREVSLQDAPWDHEAYWESSSDFLSNFGQHIWHLAIGPSLDITHHDHLIRNYQALRQALSQMPNLRTLVVYGFDCNDLGRQTLFGRTMRLRRYIRNYPLPELPQLHTVSLLLPVEVNSLMYEIMRRYSSHLKKILMKPSVWMNGRRYIHPQPEMTDMELVFDESLPAWQRLCQTLVAPKLAKLSIVVWEGWRISDLLQPLRRNFPSLVYLKLAFRRRCRNFRGTDPPEFQLENIKTLEIEDSPDIEYDQILSYLPCLEYILVCHNPIVSSYRSFFLQERSREYEEFEIRKAILAESMYQSDVWTRIQSLKEFTIARLGDRHTTEEDIVVKLQFTREEYNLKCGERE